jgi:hypothetical protein
MKELFYDASITPFFRQLTWEGAIRLAYDRARLTIIRQRVFKHPEHGWTFEDARGREGL